MSSYQLPPPGDGNPAKRWLQAALATAGGAALIVLSFFFALFALAAAALLIAVIGARWRWMLRKARRAAERANGVVEGEYQVIERDEDGPR